MSRSPNRNDYLPPIKTVYEESYGSARGSPITQSHQIVAIPRRRDSNGGYNTDRYIHELENRLEVQERTTQQLVDKAIGIKQELIDNLGLSQGSWQEERGARELLQEHVRTITAVIRQMNKDIKSLDSQIREKENALLGTGNAVRQIETSQMSSVGELRSRIGRADSAIAKLAGDIRLTNDSIKSLNVDLHDHQTKVLDKIQTIEVKSHDTDNRIDKLTNESSSNIRLSLDESIKKLSDLDNRTRLALDELRHQINNTSLYSQSEREKMETKLLSSTERLFTTTQSRLEKLEETVNSEKYHSIIQDRLDSLESEFKIFYKDRTTFEKDLDRKLTMYSDRLYRQQTDDFARFKREVRDGFAAVHETINNIKSVMEGKQRLMEESLRKEITQLRKMVVLI